MDAPSRAVPSHAPEAHCGALTMSQDSAGGDLPERCDPHQTDRQMGADTFHRSGLPKAAADHSTAAAREDHEHTPTQSELIERYSRRYIELGWAPVPLRSKKKSPASKGWTEEQLDLPGITAQVDRGHDNLGIKTGLLVDLDLDSRESRQVLDAAPEILDNTATFGRGGEITHALVMVENSTITRTLFKDPSDQSVILEVRGQRHQTMVPPSIHPTGQRLTWHSAPDRVVTFSQDRLLARAGVLAAISLLVKHMPGDGARDEVALWLAGALLLAGWSEAQAEGLIRTAFRIGGAHDVDRKVAKVRQTAKAIEREKIVSGISGLRECLPPKVANRIAEWLGLEEQGEKGSRTSPKDRLVAIGAALELWRDAVSQDVFATATVAGRVEHLRIQSRAFKRYLAAQYHAAFKKAPEDGAVRNALAVLEGMAQEGPLYRTGIRLMMENDAILLDLCNERGEIVRITSEGFHVEVAGSDVRFIRPPDMQPLPRPEAGGSIDLLRPFLNTSDAGFTLLVGTLLCWLNPHGPYPILILHGEAGTGKSHAMDLLRSLVDPSRAQRASPPKAEDDLVVAAANQQVATFDNVSGIKQELSDALCRLATGGGIKKRWLYTNGELYTLDVKRPVAMTCITIPHVPDDFISRMIAVEMERLDGGYRRESDLHAEFEACRPLILGALLAAVSHALSRANEDLRDIAGASRLASSIHWVEQAAPALGWTPGTFSAVYGQMREALYDSAADSHPLVEWLSLWVASMKVEGKKTPEEQAGCGVVFEGGLKQLLSRLEQFAVNEMCPIDQFRREGAWPRSAAHLSRRIKELAASLRQRGVGYSTRESGSSTIWTITRTKVAEYFDPLEQSRRIPF